jgi:hypothetical protein
MSAHDLTKVTLGGVIDDVSTAGQIYIPVPKMFDGTILQIVATLDAAITTADATLTVKHSDGTSIGTLTITQSGSAAGSTFVGDLNGLCRPGAAIEVETDGGSSTAVKCYVTIVIKR